jgi:hypothetical protein
MPRTRNGEGSLFPLGSVPICSNWRAKIPSLANKGRGTFSVKLKTPLASSHCGYKFQKGKPTRHKLVPASPSSDLFLKIG